MSEKALDRLETRKIVANLPHLAIHPLDLEADG